jgi:hypothetical protein
MTGHASGLPGIFVHSQRRTGTAHTIATDAAARPALRWRAAKDLDGLGSAEVGSRRESELMHIGVLAAQAPDLTDALTRPG